MSSASGLRKEGERRLSYGEPGTKSVLFNIKNKSGINIEKVVLEPFKSEKEVLMRKGAKYKVIKIKKFTYINPSNIDEKYESIEMFLKEI